MSPLDASGLRSGSRSISEAPSASVRFELNSQLVLADLDSSDVCRNCAAIRLVLIRCGSAPIVEMQCKRVDHYSFDVRRRHPADRARRRLCQPAKMRLGHVIPITHAVLGRVCRSHGCPASSNSSPDNSAADLLRVTVRCDHCSVSFACTASNSSRSRSGGCGPGQISFLYRTSPI